MFGAYHLARKTQKFQLKVKRKLQEICSEVVYFLQKYSSFSIWDGTAKISLLPVFATFSS